MMAHKMNDEEHHLRTETESRSDEESGDEYLARVLASDTYLRDDDDASSVRPTIGIDRAKGSDDGKQRTSTLPSNGHADEPSTILIHHPACELHCVPGHPEQPARVRAIMDALLHHYPDICTILAPVVTREQMVRFHPMSHVERIERLCSKAENWAKAARKRRSSGNQKTVEGDTSPLALVSIDGDTAVMERSRDAVMRAAGAACFAAEEVMEGRAINAFCCVRPPGHHAEPEEAMGFCFLNNAAIGALHAQATYGLERLAVIDFDVHHGNGTEAFFQDNTNLFYGSTHQGPYFYPGTGHDENTGICRNVVNVGMKSGDGSDIFRTAYSEKIIPALEDFRPNIIIISAGFDAHAEDPLAGLMLKEDDFGWVTDQICAVASRVCEGRVVSILEGGYDLDAISDSAVAHVGSLRRAALEVRQSIALRSTREMTRTLTNEKTSTPLKTNGETIVDAPVANGRNVESGGNDENSDVSTCSPRAMAAVQSPSELPSEATSAASVTDQISNEIRLEDQAGRSAVSWGNTVAADSEATSLSEAIDHAIEGQVTYDLDEEGGALETQENLDPLDEAFLSLAICDEHDSEGGLTTINTADSVDDVSLR